MICKRGLKGSVSRGLTSADINPTQNQAALQGVPSPTRFGKYNNLKSTGKMPGLSVLVKKHGLSNSPGFYWRAEWQGADVEKPPHGITGNLKP